MNSVYDQDFSVFFWNKIYKSVKFFKVKSSEITDSVEVWILENLLRIK